MGHVPVWIRSNLCLVVVFSNEGHAENKIWNIGVVGDLWLLGVVMPIGGGFMQKLWVSIQHNGSRQDKQRFLMNESVSIWELKDD